MIYHLQMMTVTVWIILLVIFLNAWKLQYWWWLRNWRLVMWMEKRRENTLQSLCNQQTLLTTVIGSEEQPSLEPSVSANYFWNVLVMDNIDMNVRRSFQCSDCIIKLYHFCYAYALHNRINTSTLSDEPPSASLILPRQWSA